MSEATGAVAASSLRPALMVVLSIVVLSAMDALITGFGPNAAVLQIVWLRYCAGTLVALVIFLATGPHRINRQSLIANGLRSVRFIILSMSASATQLRVLAPAAASSPPNSVFRISSGSTVPRPASSIAGMVVTRSNSITRGFVSAR